MYDAKLENVIYSRSRSFAQIYFIPSNLDKSRAYRLGSERPTFQQFERLGLDCIDSWVYATLLERCDFFHSHHVISLFLPWILC